MILLGIESSSKKLSVGLMKDKIFSEFSSEKINDTANSLPILSKQIINNAKVLASALSNRGINIVSGGTDTHLLLVDLRNKNVTGRAAEIALESVGITCNKNGVPFDPLKPAVTSGIRLGSPACTTRGFGIAEFQLIADLIADTIEALGDNVEPEEELMASQRRSVKDLCLRFPIY